MTDPQHTPENDLDRGDSGTLNNDSPTPEVTGDDVVDERPAPPEGWEHNEVDGGITAVDVPWKGYTG